MAITSSNLGVLLCLALFSHLAFSAPIDRKGILSLLLDLLTKKNDNACCTALDRFLPGKVSFPTNLSYTSSQITFWSAQEQSLHPSCIVIPTSTQDVSTAVTILNPLPATAGHTDHNFSHTPHAGAANIDGGVTIDTQSLNQVTVSSDQKTVSVGPGNRWGNVYSTLDALNVAMVGGRLSQVGVAGLVTGGGVSFFSGRYGFACDNIKAYEVVLGNGTTVTATSTSNPRLFRALKGGSNNFGIVTRFDAVLFQQDAFLGGQIDQPITNKEAYFDFLADFTQSETYDPFSALITVFAWLQSVPIVTIMHTVTYTNGSASWPPPAFKPLDDMPKLSSSVRKAKLSSFANEIGGDAAISQGKNNFFVTLSFVNNPAVTPEFMKQVYKLVDDAAQDLFLALGLALTMAFQPLPHVLYSKGGDENVLGLGRFEDDLINLLFTVIWPDPLNNQMVYDRMRTLENALIGLAKDNGIYNEWVYLNYASQWQNPITAYGASEVAFLKSVSKQYDPQGIFQKAVPGGFKLGL
ncbi:oxidoreductase FAD-binding protein [Paraphaeosphaeria sporulosa]|uniref:Oxidoreductase FAD-binding protein n=1 Tax=Paraphaeosphaeria sporulosa TaxID=1460663 RepID=A0A177BXZ1_9PLEO|nr:oxidoreductase FAD-binding protein [Paraphaeosphaeria sporulosa]OAF99199.1 oxidoreductase FAD-binding protein [Paraphaeosphaeria sporulosa]